MSKAQGYAAVSPLVRRGLVEKVNGQYCLTFTLELPPPGVPTIGA